MGAQKDFILVTLTVAFRAMSNLSVKTKFTACLQVKQIFFQAFSTPF